MVAITVILAAVLGTFVLGLGSGVSNTIPSATFDFHYVGGVLTITDTGGDVFTSDETASLNVTANGTTQNWSLPVSAGEEFTVGPAGQLNTTLASGDTVQIVWLGNSGKSSIIAKFTIP